jgi:hypothetical protein
MSEQPTKDPRSICFMADGGDELDIQLEDDGDLYVSITDANGCIPLYLSNAQATTLRDWLNKVLSA